MENFELMSQGAEARLYSGTYLGRATVVKERFEKKYRHPELHAQLTKERIAAEARAIVRAKAAGVRTPALYLVDQERHRIYMEDVKNAQTLKSFIDERSDSLGEELHDSLANKIGQVVAKLHSKNIIHGDLTTSNFLIRTSEIGESLVLIDFGLARVESTVEDKAVDLYVLERSLLSSHSQFTQLFPTVLARYFHHLGDNKHRREIESKYNEVRARGRKRLMVG